jgi:hypothetical protein
MKKQKTSWSRDFFFFEKLIYVKVVKKFFTFYGTRNFIIVFTRSWHYFQTQVNHVHIIISYF